MINDIMEGYNKEDYELYSKHFDEKLKHAMPEKVFKQIRGQIHYKIGKYLYKGK